MEDNVENKKGDHNESEVSVTVRCNQRRLQVRDMRVKLS